MLRNTVLAVLAAASTILVSPLPATAQDFPNRPMHVVIGFAAGSGADILCRWYTTRLAEVSKQAVVIENKPGAIGTIAGSQVAKSRPDGYTILFTGNSMMAAGHLLVKDIAFDGTRDFVPAAALFETPFVLTVGAKSPIQSVADLVRHLKAKPGSRYGYTNPTAYLATAYFTTQTATQADAVAYRLSPDSLAEVENGTLDFMIYDGTFSIGQINAGRLRALASTTDRRISALPTVPTMQEAGLAQYHFSPWWAAYLPAGTPQPVVNRVGSWVTEITSAPEAAKFLEPLVAMPVIDDSAGILARLKKDRETWERLAKITNLQPQ